VILITHDLGVVAGMTSRLNVMYAGFVVESASTPDLFARPRHPYTVGLLHSMPRLDAQPGEPLIPIEGVPPTCAAPPSGAHSRRAAPGAWRVAGPACLPSNRSIRPPRSSPPAERNAPGRMLESGHAR